MARRGRRCCSGRSPNRSTRAKGRHPARRKALRSIPLDQWLLAGVTGPCAAPRAPPPPRRPRLGPGSAAMRIFPFLLLVLGGPLEPIGRLDHPAIREASGIVASRRHPGVFWVHNDSGNPPALYAVRRDGRLVREYAVGAPNLDWE